MSVYTKYKENLKEKQHNESFFTEITTGDPIEEKLLKSRKALKGPEKRYLKKKLKKYKKKHTTLKTVVHREEVACAKKKRQKKDLVQMHRGLEQKKIKYSKQVSQLRRDLEDLEKARMDAENMNFIANREFNKTENNSDFFTANMEMYEKSLRKTEDILKELGSKRAKLQQEIPLIVKEIDKKKKEFQKIDQKIHSLFKRKSNLTQKEFELETDRLEQQHENFLKNIDVTKKDSSRGTLKMLVNMKDILRDEYKKAIGTIEFNHGEEIVHIKKIQKEELQLKKKLEDETREYYSVFNGSNKQKILVVEKLKDELLNLRNTVHHLTVSCSSVRNDVKKMIVKKNQAQKSQKSLLSERKSIENFIEKIRASLIDQEKIIEKNMKKMSKCQDGIRLTMVKVEKLDKEVHKKQKAYDFCVKTEKDLKKKFERLTKNRTNALGKKKLAENNEKLAQSLYEKKHEKLEGSRKGIDDSVKKLNEVESRILLVSKNPNSKTELAELKNQSGKLRFRLEKLRVTERRFAMQDEKSRHEWEESKKLNLSAQQVFKAIEIELSVFVNENQANIVKLKKTKIDFNECRKKRKKLSTRSVDRSLKEIKMATLNIENARKKEITLSNRENSYCAKLEIKKARVELIKREIKNLEEIIRKKTNILTPIEKQLVELRKKLTEKEARFNVEKREKLDELEKNKHRLHSQKEETSKILVQKMMSIVSVVRSCSKNEVLIAHITSKKKKLFEEFRKAEREYEIVFDDFEKEKKRFENYGNELKEVSNKRSKIEFPSTKDVSSEVCTFETTRRDVEMHLDFVEEEIIQSEEYQKILRRKIKKLIKKISTNKKNAIAQRGVFEQCRKKLNRVEKKREGVMKKLADLEKNVLESLVSKAEDIENEKLVVERKYESLSTSLEKLKVGYNDLGKRISTSQKKITQ